MITEDFSWFAWPTRAMQAAPCYRERPFHYDTDTFSAHLAELSALGPKISRNLFRCNNLLLQSEWVNASGRVGPSFGVDPVARGGRSGRKTGGERSSNERKQPIATGREAVALLGLRQFSETSLRGRDGPTDRDRHRCTKHQDPPPCRVSDS